MLTKNFEKLIRGLSQRKNRKKSGLFVAEGMKLVRDFLSAGTQPVIIYSTEAERTEIEGHTVVHISEAEMKRITFLEHPSPIVALLHQRQCSLADFAEAPFVLMLDRVQDPGNVGTLLRTALWYGVEHIAMVVGSADPWSPKVVQASMSALAFSKVLVLEEEEWISWAEREGFSWAIADMNGVAARRFNWQQKQLLVLGNEGQGPSDRLRSLGEAITLPGDATRMESLNVAVSGATLLYEYACAERP